MNLYEELMHGPKLAQGQPGRAKELRDRGYTTAEICRRLNASKSSVRRWLRDINQKQS